MKQRVFNILISFAVGVLGVVQVLPYLKEDEPPEIKVVLHIDNKEKQPDFFSKSPQEGLMEALEYYGLKHPQIVFGLYNSKKHRYHTFNHWTESVVAYLDYVQHRYKPPNDYYKFLLDIGYAKDPNYISKLKVIVNRNDKRRSE